MYDETVIVRPQISMFLCIYGLGNGAVYIAISTYDTVGRTPRFAIQVYK